MAEEGGEGPLKETQEDEEESEEKNPKYDTPADHANTIKQYSVTHELPAVVCIEFIWTLSKDLTTKETQLMICILHQSHNAKDKVYSNNAWKSYISTFNEWREWHQIRYAPLTTHHHWD